MRHLGAVVCGLRFGMVWGIGVVQGLWRGCLGQPHRDFLGLCSCDLGLVVFGVT